MTLRRTRRERRRRAAPPRAEPGATVAVAPRAQAMASRLGKAALVAFGAALAILWSASALADDALERALSLTAAERYGEARQAVDGVLAREPGSPRARLLHGVLRVREDRKSEAVGIFEELARDRPDMFEAHNNLAVLYAEEGRLDAARATLRAALQRRPERVGYRNLGDIYTQLARRAYARGRAAEPRGEAHAEAPTDAADKASARAGAPTDDEAPAAAADKASARAEAPEDAAPAAASGAACMAAGEFKDPANLREARQWLRSQGAEIVGEKSRQREIVRNYLVYLPPFPSRAAAAAKMRELRDRGIHDIALVSGGSLTNAVSLGVYRNKAYMDRHVLRLKELGYPAVWKARRGKTGYRVLEARVAGATDALGAAWASQFPGHTLSSVDCP